ncbi:MAG TPA: SprT-like domain-containing protein [Pyrinomonadaceae bacterium]|nr:SprT-like domain-containing protein [Pyrinomonadaceae bacterium]
MSDSGHSIGAHIQDAFRHLAPKRPVPEVDARYYPYAGLTHTIRLRSGRVHVRVSDIFAPAPPDVQRALAFMLVSKLLRRRTPPFHEKLYRNYACRPEVLRASDLARRHRGRKQVSTSRGRVYDLERMFARLNRRYFDGEIEQPTLTWSRRRTRTILGHHDGVHDTIVISKTLDSEDVPEWFVEFVLFHEMLHIKHPARLINGRRYYHTKSFRAEEQRFPFYEEAQDWLDNFARRRRTIPRARAA